MKRFIFSFIIILVPGIAFSQKVPKTDATETISLQCYGGTANRTALAYNPERKLYYSVNGGAIDYAVETFSETGDSLGWAETGFDYRGAWWNPGGSALEGNGRFFTGIWEQNLNTGTGVAVEGGLIIMQVNVNLGQLVGDLDYKNNFIIYYSDGHVVRFDRADHTIADSLEIIGLPDTEFVNSTSVVYTGIDGFEYGLYNYDTKDLYYINASTGVFSGRTHLPATAAAPVNFRISFANEQFWIFNGEDRQWVGYDVFEDFLPAATKEPFSEGIEDIRLATSQGSNTRTGLAFDPANRLYYSVNGGTDSRPIETFYENAEPAHTSPAGFDYRGVWWNPYSRALEGNGHDLNGIYRHSLNENGYAISDGMNIKPGTSDLGNLIGDYDYVNNLFVYYDNGSLSFFSAVDNEHMETVAVSGLEYSENTNPGSVVFTGVKGYEYGIYDFVDRELVFIDAETKNVSGRTPLPDNAPQVDLGRVAFTNNMFWLYSDSDEEWISYKIFCDVVYDENVLTICDGDSVFLQGQYQFVEGVYFDTLTAASGCDSIIKTELFINIPPSVDLEDVEVCSGEEVVLLAEGEAEFEWSHEVENGVPFVPEETGVYMLTITEESGCFSKDSVLVTVLERPVIDAGEDQEVCGGEEVILEATGVESYEWSGDVINGEAFIPESTTSYSVLGTDEYGCSDSSTVLVTVSERPQIDAGEDLEVCAGEEITLAATGGESYEWSGGVVNGEAFIPGSTTSYSVLGTDEHGCTDSSSVLVTVRERPQVDAGEDLEVCAGEEITLTAIGGESYEWSGGVVNGEAFIPESTTSYIVLGTDEHGCSDSSNVLVTVSERPQIDAGEDLEVCAGEEITLTAIGGESYEWSGGVVNGEAFIPGSTTSYSVLGTDEHGCTDSSSVLVTVHERPEIDAGEDLEICAGEEVTLTARGGESYEWSGGISNGRPFVPVSTTTYVVLGTDEHGCTDSSSVLVTVHERPEIYAGEDKAVCSGSEVVLTASGLDDFSWSGGIVDGEPFIPESTSIFVVTGTGVNGCSGADSVVVAVYELPNVFAGADVEVCAGEELTLAGSGAVTYDWEPAIEDGVAFVPAESRVYIVSGTDENGCKGSDSLQVKVNDNPEVSAGDDVVVCAGQGVVLSGTGANIYSWSHNVVNNRAFLPQETRIYTVVGVDENGCSGTDEVVVEVNPAPNVALFIPVEITTQCSDGSPIYMSGGSPSGGVFWGNGISGGVFNPSAADEGTHVISYTYTDENNCSASAEQEIKVEICTSVEKAEVVDFIVYPNPSSGQVHIRSDEQLSIKVFNSKGKLLKYSEAVQYLSLELPSGLYFIHGHYNEKEVVKKLVIN
ncbi:T9SS type A sorting domain-containing protein [Cytophagaceae bacterium ABcell3]|nr:T9SS type A sorting domain-containing protein [Cytophagaceae bacterium ABcell3]